MIITLALALIVAGLAFTRYKLRWWDDWDIGPCIAYGMTIILLIVAIVVICFSHCLMASDYSAMMCKHDMLVYQLENELYLNDNNVGTTELMEQIMEYNQCIVRHQTAEHNLWVSWFVEAKLADLPMIELP